MSHLVSSKVRAAKENKKVKGGYGFAGIWSVTSFQQIEVGIFKVGMFRFCLIA
jgi:hypothetical protein